MSLRKKTGIIVGLTLVGVIGFLYFIARALWLSGFAQLEQQSAQEDVQRALNALSNDLAMLENSAIDWAWWDDTYQFIQDGNEAYVESNLVDSAFLTLQINVMLFVDQSSRVVYGQAYDLHSQQFTALAPTVQEHLLIERWSPADDGDRPLKSGILLVQGMPMMFVTLPILNSQEDLPARGAMIWGRYLDSLVIRRYAEMTQLSITMQEYYDPQIPADFQEARTLLSAESQILVRPLSDQVIAGYALVQDIHGGPAFILKVDSSRDIYRHGQSTFSSVLLSVSGISLIFGTITLLLLERVVLSRVVRLKGDVYAITSRSDLSARVAVVGRDELSDLAASINAMLETIQHAQIKLQQAQESLERSAHLAAAGEIAAGVAHQVNNPLTTIIAECFLLLSHLPPGSETYESVEAIQEAARRAGEAVQQLLDLTRSVPYDMERVDVNDSLESAITLVRAQIEPQARLLVDLAPGLPPIRASAQHLADVVWINLLLNARDAVSTVADGQIRVSTAFNAREKVIEAVVQDNGVGIPAEHLAHIFEPFFTTKPQGTGLGLTICLDVIRRHGGSIRVESREGIGTRFEVRLPVEA